MKTEKTKESFIRNLFLPTKVTLSSVYKKEIIFGLFFLIYPVMLFFFPITGSAPTSTHLTLFKLGNLGCGLLVSFGRIFSGWNKIKLDEREWTILNKATGAASFILIFLMIFLYTFGGQIKTLAGETLNDHWAFYMCPVFLIAHAMSVMILNKIE